ncbi:MAG TPA: hypothetical protein VL485_24135 [Ktedonobacteraceae bacterium]|jgi:hypothetical protein|nr:hypothetical protein [Ktedonobacteraceae bacterium]
MAQIIKRGVLVAFDNASYTASVQILEATSTLLSNVPIATHVDNSSALPGALCAVLFFDAQNPADAVIIAMYPNGSTGLPAPPPGRVSYIAPVLIFSSFAIGSGSTSTWTIVGIANNIPTNATGVLCKAYFTSSTVGAYITVAPAGAGANSGKYLTVGNLQVSGQFLNGAGLVPLDSLGRLDIGANTGTCTTTLYVYGYTN